MASTVLVFASTALLVASAPVVVGSTADVAASGLVAAQAFRPPVRSTAFVGRAFAPTDQDGSSRPSFSEWLAGLRAEAITRGIKPDVVDAALAGVSEPVQLILERDRSQAETVFSLESYIRKRLTPKLIAAGRDAFARERELVDRVGEKYGVPPRLIAAIWGIESNYGHFSGVRPTVPALATLAWDPRRATFFRGELFDALEILNRGDIDLEHMRGSWAGAMGQVQFMPSSYLKYAEDYDGDGRRDIWSSSGDVFASIANYLKGHGWQGESTWGREVKMSPEVARRIRADVAPRTGGCQALRNMTVALPASRWDELGVRLPNGKPIAETDEASSMVLGSTRYFLVHSNYDAILEYNCSHSYAITVALLGDAIASPARVAAPKRQASSTRTRSKAPLRAGKARGKHRD